MKQKTCKICKAKFTPQNPLQLVCDYQCSIEYSKIHLKKTELKKAKLKKSENKVKLDELKSLSHWNNLLQKDINKIIRLIDVGCPCISSGRPYRSDDQAGHFYSIGSNPALRFNLLNLWSQSIKDNMHNSGNLLNYRQSLVDNGLIELIEEQKLKYPVLKLSKEQIKSTLPIAKSIIRELLSIHEANNLPLHLEFRVSLRLRYQELLKIYG
jgi:hypothetical protein